MTDYAISALTTGIPAPADLLAFVKVADHSTAPAGAGGSDQKVTFGAALIPLQATGVAATDTPNLAAAVVSGQPVAPGNYSINATLTPDTGQSLNGIGPGVIITAAGGFSGSFMWQNKTAASSVQTALRNVTLVPSTGSVGGVFLDNTGLGSGDPRHILQNVYVNNSKGDAFKFGNNIRSCIIEGCQQYFGQAFGFNIQSGATDNFFTGCLSGWSTNHGFNVAGSNNMFSCCKAFFAGFNGSTWGTTQAGFAIGATVCNSFASCQAQQNALHGFDLQGCASTTVSGCDADSNSSGTTGGVGINLNGVTYSSITGNTGYNNTGLTPQAQLYGIQVNGTQTGTNIIGNSVTGANGQFNYVGGFGYFPVDNNQADFSQVAFFKIPAPVLAADNVQTIASNGTILTATHGNFALIPVTAAGAVTGIILEAPAQGNSEVAIVNRANFTMTMATALTSHVALGTGAVIPALGKAIFIYDSGTSLWYGP